MMSDFYGKFKTAFPFIFHVIVYSWVIGYVAKPQRFGRVPHIILVAFSADNTYTAYIFPV